MAFVIMQRLSPVGVPKYFNGVLMNFVQVAGITSAGGKPRPRPCKPFDYRRKKFKFIDQPFDRTLKRMDENSKVVVIDGPIASGKTEFARRLAKQLDFKFVPQPNVKDLWKCGNYGLTYQDLDELLPPDLRIYDLETLLKDPAAKVADGGGRAGWLQVEYFAARIFAYNDALLHLLSTGQGVVCVRSPWSDRVFAKALYNDGYMSKAGYDYYTTEVAKNHLCDYPRPHLTIYLDADVTQTKENISRRKNPIEINSKVFSDKFLKSIEDEYKEAVLPHLESHGELLVYPSIPDITDHEVEMMVEDIEALGDLKHSGFTDDHRLDDWEHLRDEELASKRRQYQDLHLASKVFTHDRPWNAPEMCQDEEWLTSRAKHYNYLPGYKWDTGYDPSLVPTWKVLLGLQGFKTESNDRRQFFIPA